MTTAFQTVLDLAPQLGSSIAALLAAGLGRRFLPQDRSRARLLCDLAAAFGLALIWIGEIQSLLLSLTAVAMALVLATKELIQCATGALARRGGRSYRIGDRVQLDGTSGRVVAMNLLTTTIAETDGRSFGSRPTGRRLVVPNSRIFSGGIHVEDHVAAYRHHAFAITLETGVALRDLLEIAVTEAAQCTAHGAPEARVALSTTEFGKPRLDIVLFCGSEAAFEAERRIALAVLERAGGDVFERPAPAPLALVRDLAA